MTCDEHLAASDGERESLEFLRKGRKLRGLSPAQLERIERRLAQPGRPARRKIWLPALAALCLVLLGGTALARVVDLSHLPVVGFLFPSHAPIRVGSRPALPGANHRGKAWKPSQGFHVSRLAARPSARSEENIRPAEPATTTLTRPQEPAAATSAKPRIPRAWVPKERAPAHEEIAPLEAPSTERARGSEEAFGAPAPFRAPAVGAWPREARPIPPAPLPEDPISVESRSFSAALAQWHRDHNAAAALAALDAHERRFPHGQIQLEATLLRAEIYLRQSREREALLLLDGVSLPGLPRGRELQTVRGELRIKYGRCADGRRDLEHVLAKDKADALGRRAARALSLCP